LNRLHSCWALCSSELARGMDAWPRSAEEVEQWGRVGGRNKREPAKTLQLTLVVSFLSGFGLDKVE